MTKKTERKNSKAPKAPNDGQLLLSPANVAYLLGCSYDEVIRLLDDRTLPHIRLRSNGFRRVRRADLDRVLAHA